MLKFVLPLGAALLLGGCTYDYLQRSDRIAYSAGDAVRANIARETDNPARPNARQTSGLGQDGPMFTAPAAGDSAE